MIKQISCSFPVPFNGKMKGEDMLMKMIPDGKQCLKMSLERNANFHILRPPRSPFLMPESHHCIMLITTGVSSQHSPMTARHSYRINIQWKASWFSLTVTVCWMLEEGKVTTSFQSGCIHTSHIVSINSATWQHSYLLSQSIVLKAPCAFQHPQN